MKALFSYICIFFGFLYQFDLVTLGIAKSYCNLTWKASWKLRAKCQQFRRRNKKVKCLKHYWNSQKLKANVLFCWLYISIFVISWKIRMKYWKKQFAPFSKIQICLIDQERVQFVNRNSQIQFDSQFIFVNCD